MMRKNEVERTWKWRTQDGRHYSVPEMDTRHLFNTVLMVWNHTMPETAKFRPFKQYEFGAFYTRKYLLQAVRRMLTELISREDLTCHQTKTLARMRAWLETNQVEMESVMRIGA